MSTGHTWVNRFRPKTLPELSIHVVVRSKSSTNKIDPNRRSQHATSRTCGFTCEASNDMWLHMWMNPWLTCEATCAWFLQVKRHVKLRICVATCSKVSAITCAVTCASQRVRARVSGLTYAWAYERVHLWNHMLPESTCEFIWWSNGSKDPPKILNESLFRWAWCKGFGDHPSSGIWVLKKMTNKNWFWQS